MSNTKQSETDFKNEDTVRRRAWIDRALNGAKERVGDGEHERQTCDTSLRPRLYVVGSNNNK